MVCKLFDWEVEVEEAARLQQREAEPPPATGADADTEQRRSGSWRRDRGGAIPRNGKDDATVR